MEVFLFRRQKHKPWEIGELFTYSDMRIRFFPHFTRMDFGFTSWRHYRD